MSQAPSPCSYNYNALHACADAQGTDKDCAVGPPAAAPISASATEQVRPWPLSVLDMCSASPPRPCVTHAGRPIVCRMHARSTHLSRHSEARSTVNLCQPVQRGSTDPARVHRRQIQAGHRKSQRRHNLWFHVNRKRRRRPRAPAPNVPDAAQSLREFVEQSFGAATMWESAGPSASTARRQSSLRYLGYACPRSHHTSPALRWQQYPHAA